MDPNQQPLQQQNSIQDDPSHVLRVRRRLFFLGAGGLLFVFFLFLIMLFGFRSAQRVVLPTPTPTPTPQKTATGNQDVQTSEEYKKSVEEIDAEQKEVMSREAAVGKLIHKLPHKGEYFELSYSFSTNQFTLTVNKASRTQGTAELEQFLQANGIEDKDWIRNLVLKYN